MAKAKFLTRVFKKNKPLIDLLMADDAARFLHEAELLAVGFVIDGLFAEIVPRKGKVRL
ncbi:hypothetical protein [Enteroscipio rubneri]|uniref:hypothetical protein n=1 Tax=Enteroscipio rubneri TaxID=2070686 RepID=UPI0012FFD4B2|nr:hypothetical protein [Enteroscipio rubneri]